MGRAANRVLVRCEHPAGQAPARSLGRRARRFLRALGVGGAELSLVVTTDRRIRRLNRDWRGKDRATDVLSFPAGPAPGPRRLLGDVVLSLDTARRAGGPGPRALGRELALYLAHGLLHLLGHDHLRAGDARRMARAEAALLGGGGMIDR